MPNHSPDAAVVPILAAIGLIQAVCACCASIGASINIDQGKMGFAVADTIMLIVCGTLAAWLFIRTILNAFK